MQAGLKFMRKIHGGLKIQNYKIYSNQDRVNISALSDGTYIVTDKLQEGFKMIKRYLRANFNP